MEESLEPTPHSSIFKVPKSIRRTSEETYIPQLVSKGPLDHDAKMEPPPLFCPPIDFGALHPTPPFHPIDSLPFDKKKETYTPQLTSTVPIYHVEKQKTYTPLSVSVGPYHRGKDELSDMEKHKGRYMKSFSQRNSSEKMAEISSFIQDNEGRIRDFYLDGAAQIKKREFERMILHDAIFIIELFVRNFEQTSDSLLTIPSTKSDLSADLQLIENQLPFFVIEGIYKLSISSPPFMNLACNFFSSTDRSFCSLPDPTVEIKHFTDLRRSVMLKGYKNCCMKRTLGIIDDLPSAAMLSRSGVKFKRGEEKCLLNVRFDKPIFPWLNCGGAELKMPNLVLYKDSERLLQNVMALEQCVYPLEAGVSSYIELINSLINTEKDVKLLIEAEIISNFVGDIASLANMFNKLSVQIRNRDSIHYGVCEDLKKHYKNHCNHARAAFKRWFIDPLKASATALGLMQVLLSLIQTILSSRANSGSACCTPC